MSVSQHLKQIEEDYDVKVLEAREFGSRAWNLETPESDHDVAFIFVEPVERYISLESYRETIDRHFGEDFQYMGWNLKTYLEHLYNCKPTAIEFLLSPEAHLSRIDMLDLRRYMLSNFNEVALYYHYRNLGKNQYKRYLEKGQKTTVKRNLYVFRGLLYAQYIKEVRDFPMLNFPDFVKMGRDSNFFDQEEIWRTITDIVDKKKKGMNVDIGVPHRKWIEKKIEEDIDTDRADNMDREVLDDFLFEWLNGETNEFR